MIKARRDVGAIGKNGTQLLVNVERDDFARG